MNKYFFSHILKIEDVHLELEESGMDKKDKVYMALLFEETVHNAIIDDLLSQLPEKDRHEFLKHLHKNQHQDTWDFLNKKVKDAKKRVEKITQDLKKEFLKDLKKKM